MIDRATCARRRFRHRLPLRRPLWPASDAVGAAPVRQPSEKLVDVECVGGLYRAQLLVKGRRLNENGKLITLARSHGEGFSSLREAIRSLRKDIEVDAWARSLAYVTNPSARQGEVDPGVYGTGAGLSSSLRRRWEEQSLPAKASAPSALVSPLLPQPVPLTRSQSIYAAFDRLADAAERSPEEVR